MCSFDDKLGLKHVTNQKKPENNQPIFEKKHGRILRLYLFLGHAINENSRFFNNLLLTM